MGQPTPSDLRWSEIESMLKAIGCKISEGRGSRVRMALNGVKAVFHRPHPSPQTKPSSVRAVRDFLIAAGVR
ncbi:type II toxin-antitoxin system HicA family toxin [Brevundimonas sp.]